MNETEFLNSWPTLAPAVWRLVKAAVKADRDVREQIGAVTQGPSPEVSPAARDAATKEIENHGVRLRSGGCGGQDYGIHVQRAMDAARYDERAKVRVAISEIEADRRREQAEVARLAKELVECHGQSGSSDPAKIGHAGLIALLRSQRDKARKEFEDERDKLVRFTREKNEAFRSNVLAFEKVKEQLAAAQSALAEHGDATAWIVTDPAFQQLSALAKRFVQSLRRDGENIFSELRSALAGKEKELAQEKEKRELLLRVSLSNAEEAQNQLSTERAAREDTAKDRDKLFNALECTISQRDALRAQLQQAEQERDEARKNVERERDEMKDRYRTDIGAPHDWRQRVPILWDEQRAERDALQKQNAALTTRNAELVKALRLIESGNPGRPVWRTDIEMAKIARDALNQSPE